MDDDELVSVLPIHYSDKLSPNVHIHQFPLLNRPLQVPPSATISGKQIRVRVKSALRKIEIHVPVDARPEVWNHEKSKDLGVAQCEDDREKNQEDHTKQREGEEPRLTYSRLRSDAIPQCGAYMLGVVRDGRLHLVPVSETHQFRPTLSYLDIMSRKARRARGAASDSESDDGPPLDPDEVLPATTAPKKEKKAAEAKEVQVSARKSGDDKGFQGGMSTARREMLLAIRAEEDEPWQSVSFCDGETAESSQVYETLFSRNEQPVECKSDMTAYLSETDSEPEPELATASSLTAFARLSATRPTSQGTLRWAVDTLTTLDFRLLRKDTALHGLVQECACTILALFDDVLQPADDACTFIPDVASILRPSFLQLLFQYRRLFRVIAARDFQPGTAPSAVVCWVDLVLAKLGDVVAFIAAGLDVHHPDRSLPASLRAQREEDNLRAAIQLPDNLDILPSTLLSERASIAAQRLTVRLMMGRHILGPALSGQDYDAFHSTQGLLSTTAEFLRQNATRVDELRFVLGPGLEYLMQQERLTSAMAISLFAAADMARDSTTNPERTTPFRPQTMAAAMQLLRFVLRDAGYPNQTNILCPLDHLDAPTSVIIRWGIVPQWAWNAWLEYHSLHADTIIFLTTAYIQHQKAGSGAFSDLVISDGRPSNQAAVISVMIDLVYRFISVLSADGHPKQLPITITGVLDGSCRLISQWINQNSCGIRNSTECCKALIILFGYLSRNGQHVALNDLVIECLTPMRKKCIRDAWKAAVEDNKFCFVEVLSQSFIQTKALLSHSQEVLPEFSEICAAQLIQFLVIMVSKGVEPTKLETILEFIEVVWERVLEVPQGRELLCETLLTCLASVNLSEIDLPLSKVTDDETIWSLGMRSGTNLFLASAFSLYIASATVNVDPLTYLEGLEHLLDMVLLICSRHFCGEDEPLALVILPTICDALAHLLEHRDDITAVYASENTRISALGSALRSIGNRDDSMCDKFGTLLKHRVSATTGRLLREMDGEQDTNGAEQGETRREYELMFCRHDGMSRLLYMVVA